MQEILHKNSTQFYKPARAFPSFSCDKCRRMRDSRYELVNLERDDTAQPTSSFSLLVRLSFVPSQGTPNYSNRTKLLDKHALQLTQPSRT